MTYNIAKKLIKHYLDGNISSFSVEEAVELCGTVEADENEDTLEAMTDCLCGTRLLTLVNGEKEGLKLYFHKDGDYDFYCLSQSAQDEVINTRIERVTPDLEDDDIQSIISQMEAYTPV